MVGLNAEEMLLRRTPQGSSIRPDGYDVGPPAPVFSLSRLSLST